MSATAPRADIDVALVTYDGRTYQVEVAAPVGDEPQELYGALAAVGFAEDSRFHPLPPVDGRQERHLVGPAGTELFGGWSEQDRAERLAALDAALARCGYADVPRYRAEKER